MLYLVPYYCCDTPALAKVPITRVSEDVTGMIFLSPHELSTNRWPY